jgi:hypothetical protein
MTAEVGAQSGGTAADGRSSHRWQVMIAILRGDDETALRQPRWSRTHSIDVCTRSRTMRAGTIRQSDAALTELIARIEMLAYRSPGLRLARRDGEGFRVVADRL